MARRRAVLLAGLAGGLVASMPGVGAAQSDTEAHAAAALASITITGADDAEGVTILGRATALAAGDYRAMMSIAKSGPSGTATTRQGAELSLSAGESGDVARVGMSLAPGDSLTVSVELYHNDEMIASARAQTER